MTLNERFCLTTRDKDVVDTCATTYAIFMACLLGTGSFNIFQVRWFLFTLSCGYRLETQKVKVSFSILVVSIA